MSGTAISVVGADFSARGRFIDVVKYPASTVNRVAYFQLGGTLEASLVNQGTGPDATVTDGGPGVAFSPGYATFSGNYATPGNFIQTGQMDAESADMTLMCVEARTDITTFRPLFGVFGNTPNGGMSLTNRGAEASDGSIAWQITWPYIASDVFTFRASTYDDASGLWRAFTGYQGALIAGTPRTIARQPDALRSARIGGGYAATSSLDLRMSMAAKHTVALTEAQVLTIYQYERSRLAALGVTVA